MFRPTLVFLLLALLLAPSSAAIDTVKDWQSIEARTEVAGKAVALVVRANRGALVEMRVKFQNKTVEVPPAELAGVPRVLLRTIRLVVPDVQSPESTTCRIELDLEAVDPARERLAVVRFVFVNESYRGRNVERHVSGQEPIQEVKEPGKTAVPAR
jgi:hypothetical protein